MATRCETAGLVMTPSRPEGSSAGESKPEEVFDQGMNIETPVFFEDRRCDKRPPDIEGGRN